MKRAVIVLLTVILLLAASACGNRETAEKEEKLEETSGQQQADRMMEKKEDETMAKESVLHLMIGDEAVKVQWEDNESVDALLKLAEDKPLTVQMSMYGGFEQVGPLGSSLPRNDVQTVTQAGDIVLYSGDQIVIFYGSNSWAYTRLGRVTDKTAEEMAEILGNGDVALTLSME